MIRFVHFAQRICSRENDDVGDNIWYTSLCVKFVGTFMRAVVQEETYYYFVGRLASDLLVLVVAFDPLLEQP